MARQPNGLNARDDATEAQRELMMDEQAERRTARTWDTRAAPVHESYDDWTPKGLLGQNEVAPIIDPQSGQRYQQRWVRTVLDGQPDYSNIAKFRNKGWEVRPLNTVADGQRLPMIDWREGDKTAQVIGFDGMVLMHRHPNLAQRERAAVARQTQLQMIAVRTNKYRDGGALGGQAAAFRVPEMTVEAQSRVTVGERPAPVDPD
jgi:hypothetical protein